MILYGLEPIVIKANPSNPASFAFFSAFLASLILLPFVDMNSVKNNIKKGILIGFFGTFLAYLSYSAGARLSTAINAALITRAEVLFSFILAYIFLGERITIKRAVYSFITLAGVIAVITRGKIVEPKMGDILLLLVPFFWQLGHIIAKKTNATPQTIAFLRNIFGSLFLLPLALVSGMEFTIYSVPEGVIIALGQIIWYASIRRIDLSLATAIITPAPAVAIAVALIMGEELTSWHIIGFTLITVGTLGLSIKREH
ncbi:putative Permease, drug/metabolite transporter (DMT) superfamily [Pyrococcus sp. ST04]|nr:putative Permease, drug/metabolite transporter (DMT) superfamily [Pyrococcus sp. ST04]